MTHRKAREGLNKRLANGCQPLRLPQPMTVLEWVPQLVCDLLLYNWWS